MHFLDQNKTHLSQDESNCMPPVTSIDATQSSSGQCLTGIVRTTEGANRTMAVIDADKQTGKTNGNDDPDHQGKCKTASDS